ncbi:hypothetical protein V8E36_003106 [Tilletia maclaganii]
MASASTFLTEVVVAPSTWLHPSSSRRPPGGLPYSTRPCSASSSTASLSAWRRSIPLQLPPHLQAPCWPPLRIYPLRSLRPSTVLGWLAHGVTRDDRAESDKKDYHELAYRSIMAAAVGVLIYHTLLANHPKVVIAYQLIFSLGLGAVFVALLPSLLVRWKQASPDLHRICSASHTTVGPLHVQNPGSCRLAAAPFSHGSRHLLDLWLSKPGTALRLVCLAQLQ